jgi:hypothetical protein
MNTYQYNYNGVIKFLRAQSGDVAIRKIFFGELKKNGNCDLTKIDLKVVRNPREARREMRDTGGNKVFSQLRHI